MRDWSVDLDPKLSNGCMEEMDLKRLEQRVDELIDAVSRLKSENQSLRESKTSLEAERSKLLENTELARNRVEAMIERLRSMENDR
jgi:cell division protein ZapB